MVRRQLKSVMIDGALRTETVSKLQNLALISLPMLRMMAITDGPKSGLFCRKVRAAAPGSLQQVGTSLRYTLIAWIGLLRCAAEKCLAGDFYSLSFARLYSLLRQEPRAFTLGELGLMLWLDSLANTNWASEIGSILNSRWPREKQRVDTMNVAWLLLGLSKNRHCAGRDRLMREALQFLTSAYNDSSGLFALDRPHWTRGLFGQKYRTVCGSFASQVYPIVALCEYAREYPGVNIVRMIRNCTDRICSLQGNSGEWWWIYDVRNSSVLADYPVYSVHQDAMGPMCLLAAMKIDLESDYTYAINKSLD